MTSEIGAMLKEPQRGLFKIRDLLHFVQFK